MKFVYILILLIGVASIDGKKYRHRRRYQQSIYSRYVFNYVSQDRYFDEFTLAPGLAVTVDFNAPGAWNHAGQNRWASYFPMCEGRLQSPVNILINNLRIINNATCLRWNNYNDDSQILLLRNTGTTLEASSTWRSGSLPTIQGGILSTTYRLSSIHFTWGNDRSGGAEHTINGVRHQLELHLLHYDIRYGSLNNALLSDDPEAILVVAILYEYSAISTNRGLQELTNAMREALTGGEQFGKGLPLLSLGANFPDGYYTYLGSLSHPPCSQIVRWIVSSYIETVGDNELSVFQSLLVNNRPLINNYRQIRELNGRIIDHVRVCRA